MKNSKKRSSKLHNTAAFGDQNILNLMDINLEQASDKRLSPEKPDEMAPQK